MDFKIDLMCVRVEVFILCGFYEIGNELQDPSWFVLFVKLKT